MTYISFKCNLNKRTIRPQLELNSPTKVLAFVKIIKSAIEWILRLYPLCEADTPVKHRQSTHAFVTTQNDLNKATHFQHSLP